MAVIAVAAALLASLATVGLFIELLDLRHILVFATLLLLAAAVSLVWGRRL